MLQALAYLHRRGILHRDLKPANVLVRDDQVKVLDFGLSSTRTDVSDGGVSGTLAYMAPELMQGAPASEQSDLYAVGMIAFELFAGHHPFRVGNPRDLIDDTLNIPPNISILKVAPASGRRH